MLVRPAQRQVANGLVAGRQQVPRVSVALHHHHRPRMLAIAPQPLREHAPRAAARDAAHGENPTVGAAHLLPVRDAPAPDVPDSRARERMHAGVEHLVADRDRQPVQPHHAPGRAHRCQFLPLRLRHGPGGHRHVRLPGQQAAQPLAGAAARHQHHRAGMRALVRLGRRLRERPHGGGAGHAHRLRPRRRRMPRHQPGQHEPGQHHREPAPTHRRPPVLRASPRAACPSSPASARSPPAACR